MTQKQQADALEDLLAPYAAVVEGDLAAWLVEPDVPAALAEAMRYCALGGGKRLRPGLVMMAARAVGGEEDGELVRRAAVAVELVHTYSLVHDDLPAMDDDELRRGRPTAHVKFGEAMGVLVGDALLTRAFGVLCEAGNGRAATLACELARAAGAEGMIAGQVADMGLCPLPYGLEGLEYIHFRKTAALIQASVRMGAICGDASGPALEAVSDYGQSLGLAFQLIDDLLDATGSTADLGKTAGKDADRGKRTHVAVLGAAGAGRVAQDLTAAAIRAVDRLGERAYELKSLAELLAKRTR